jgi:K+-sensing histidine kinase KdpD
MAQHASTLSTDEVTEFSEMALKSVQRLHGEIEDILQYLSTRSMGKPGEGFNLSHLQSVVSRISENLELKSVPVSVQENLNDVWVLLSQRAVELVLWEILENSKKFHPRQNPAIEINVSRSGIERVGLNIKDDGLSLSPEQLSQMWTPYYQGEKYSTGEIKGMGLGLSTVASLVWEAGGTCSAYNREDKAGIIIELILPVVEAIESEK